MRCTYTYTEDEKDKEHVAEECGSDADLEQFKEAMEYAAIQFDTIPECSVPW